MMKWFDDEIQGEEVGTSVNLELSGNGLIHLVKIYTDAPRTCCVSSAKLDKEGVDNLISALQEARGRL